MKTKKYGAHAKEELSATQYNGLIGIILLYGFCVNYLMIQKFTEVFLSWNLGLLLLGFMVLEIIGAIMSKASDNPIISLIGYNLLVIPTGAVFSVCLSGISPDLVKNVVLVTAAVTAIMLATSTFFPKVFCSMGSILLISLSAVVVVELFLVLIFGMTTPTLWHVIVALIFCGYIGYDWAVAQNVPYTVDNAIDVCVDLYLDIVNLSLRLLSIMKSSDDD